MLRSMWDCFSWRKCEKHEPWCFPKQGREHRYLVLISNCKICYPKSEVFIWWCCHNLWTVVAQHNWWWWRPASSSQQMVLQCRSAAQLRPALQQLGKTWLRNPALLLGNLCQFVCSHTSLSLLVFSSWSLTWHNFWWGFKMCKYCALRSDYCTNSSVPWVWASSTYYKKKPL